MKNKIGRLLNSSLLIGFSVLLVGSALVGCTHSIHEVQVSDFQPYAPLASGRIVRGEGGQFVFLGFTTQTNYVEQAVRNLEDQCKGGVVTGITTQISTDHGFFSWTNRALLQGLCLARVGV